MSYILDALKKSQAEQAADGVALRMQQPQPEKRTYSWLVALLVVVLLANAGLLAWIFLVPAADPQVAEPAAQSTSPPEQAAVAPKPSQKVTPAPIATPIPQPQAPPQPQPQPQQAPQTETLTRVALRDLPIAEQSLYNGFTYSTHIYTDDPSLCAIVVDGQRLQIGDAFKGLKVTAITEAGVVFEENRRGVVREVEVDLMEQWED